MRHKDNHKQWIDCSTTTSGGIKLYLETLIDNPEETFLNVQSATGCSNVGAIQTFTWEDTRLEYIKDKYGYTTDINTEITEKMSLLRQGWRIPVNDYLEVAGEEGHFISWTDLSKASGRGKTRIQQLINCGSLGGIIKDGPAILSHKPLETLVREINEIVKPGNARKAEAGAKARWDSNKTNSSSGSSR